MAESPRIYEESYKELSKLKSRNATSSITIDYNKLDMKSAAELKKAIDSVLVERKAEVYKVVLNSNGSGFGGVF